MALNIGEIQRKLSSLKNWSLEINSIMKEYTFPGFRESIDFVNRVAEIAEKHGHHPDILISYNVVRITLTTHKENSITEKDFAVAEEIDKII